MGFLRRMIVKKGAFPADVRAELQRERVVLLAEGIPATITRTPTGGGGGRSRTSATIAALGISQQRLAIYALGEPVVDVTWDSGLARELDLLARDDGLTIAFDADALVDDGDGDTGHLGLVLRIGDAGAVLKAIDQRRRPLEPRRRRD